MKNFDLISEFIKRLIRVIISIPVLVVLFLSLMIYCIGLGVKELFK